MSEEYKLKISYFGKMPFHSDFLKYRASSAVFHSLDQWFQKGIFKAKKKCGLDFQLCYKNLPHYKFLYQPENTEQSIIGTFDPGEDESGRKFPFFIFRTGRPFMLNETPEYCCETDSRLLKHCQEFWERIWSGADSEIFKLRFENWMTHLNERDENFHGNILVTKSNSDFWQEIVGSFMDRKKYLIIQNIIDSIANLKASGISRFLPGLKFPLSSIEENAIFEVSFWVNLTDKIIGKNQLYPTLFWNSENSQNASYLYLYLREPFSQDFLYLLQPELEQENAPINLTTHRASKWHDVHHSMAPWLITLLDQEDINLAEFLQEFSLMFDRL